MSYGTAAPELDFEQFQVACLSGRNGQGKSALLDAITWSLWGEARKSSGGHKPDDELLRIGQREMQVEFVFDVEGERYRVVRSYARSASGKTSRSELELHVREATKGDYRPITGSSMRATQEKIGHVVGLDYDTFINSAFLLQGRSDEFTKKRPSERKEILARILNLSRYEALYSLAGERERDARRAVEQASLDVERLQKALEPEQEWKTQRADLEATIETERGRLAVLRAEEKTLTEALGELEGRAREADDLRRSLEGLKARLKRREQEAADLRGRIREAKALIARREEIQRDHERRQALEKERDELDQKNELFRGIEKQIERAESNLKDRKNALERQLDRLEVEQKSDARQRDEHAAQLAEEPSVQRQLNAARTARQQFEAMSQVAQKREALDEQIRALEQSLHGLRESLRGKINALNEQIHRERNALPATKELEAEKESLEAAIVRLGRLKQKMEETEEQGKAVAEDLHKHGAQLTATQEKLAAVQEQLDLLADGVGGRCPTCGTELTTAHRAEVRQQFDDEIAALRKEEGFLRQKAEQRKTERARIGETYRQLRAQVNELDGAPERLATVQEQLRRAAERRAVLKAQEQEVEVLQRQLDEGAYETDQRKQLQTVRAERDQLAFDAERYERLRDEAAKVSHFEDRLNRLEEVKGRNNELERRIEQRKKEIASLRIEIDEGTTLALLQEKIRTLNEQLAGVGFDARRLREVKQQLEALSDAGERMTALVNAQQNHAEWKEKLTEVEALAEQVRAEQTEKAEKLAAVEKELGGRAELEAKQQAKSSACRKVEAQLNDLQIQLGQLNEKLEQAERDRVQLRQRRKDRDAARRKRNLYKHLKAAFGKHGIPSLIIEQTLPEIEDRANELLERLTDGRMHVRLETLKDKKTGGTKETLEIKITDEQGVSRPYETFSGGEAFRVNFALRLALAQLLAERNGIRVRTLVIDEGFGTQDQQGVQNLVEAIQMVQDDFDKILVITHLPDLKEAFPVRIEVEKDPAEGSSFEIMGV